MSAIIFRLKALEQEVVIARHVHVIAFIHFRFDLSTIRVESEGLAYTFLRMNESMFDDQTKSSSPFISPAIIWCLLMPSIHLFSLFSNILCIAVFCSGTFIKKPIAIYFISLLISDSAILLIGYMEMIDRESKMIDSSSWLCTFNHKAVRGLVDYIYVFMERFCLEWILFKVMWTRVSTIILAILSIQRSRTFFSLSYHETRLSAFLACLSSILIAFVITCLEWIGIQCAKSRGSQPYLEIFQLILSRESTKESYSSMFYQSNTTLQKYPCIGELLNGTASWNTSGSVCCSRDYW